MLKKLAISLIFLFIPAILFADVTIIDSSGLTRASKRGIEQAVVSIEFPADQKVPVSLSLANQDGSGDTLVSDRVENKKAVFDKVPSGTWKVSSKNGSYKVKIN